MKAERAHCPAPLPIAQSACPSSLLAVRCVACVRSGAVACGEENGAERAHRGGVRTRAAWAPTRHMSRTAPPTVPAQRAASVSGTPRGSSAARCPPGPRAAHADALAAASDVGRAARQQRHRRPLTRAGVLPRRPPATVSATCPLEAPRQHGSVDASATPPRGALVRPPPHGRAARGPRRSTAPPEAPSRRKEATCCVLGPAPDCSSSSVLPRGQTSFCHSLSRQGPLDDRLVVVRPAAEGAALLTAAGGMRRVGVPL
jgi:hypothetical protein